MRRGTACGMLCVTPQPGDLHPVNMCHGGYGNFGAFCADTAKAQKITIAKAGYLQIADATEQTGWALMMLMVDAEVQDLLQGASALKDGGVARQSMRVRLCAQGGEGGETNKDICCLAGATVHASGHCDVRIVWSCTLPGQAPRNELTLRAPTTEERMSWLSGCCLCLITSRASRRKFSLCSHGV